MATRDTRIGGIGLGGIIVIVGILVANFGPLWLGIVIVLALFILLDRDKLSDKIVRLFGKSWKTAPPRKNGRKRPASAKDCGW